MRSHCGQTAERLSVRLSATSPKAEPVCRTRFHLCAPLQRNRTAKEHTIFRAAEVLKLGYRATEGIYYRQAAAYAVRGAMQPLRLHAFRSQGRGMLPGRSATRKALR